MNLPTPVLDDRTFEQLVAEARTRIPQYTSEWTDFNDADPGMTLVKVHAWLTETILYRLNKLPDLNYIKFLELLNVRPRPAVAAHAQLTFMLKKLAGPTDPLTVLIPKNSQVGVDDPDLEEELIFETDRTLTALNAELSLIIVPDTSTSSTRVSNIVKRDPSTDKAVIEYPFYPFGSPATENRAFWLGIVLRPQRKLAEPGTNEVDPFRFDSFPAGNLDMAIFVPQVFEQDAEQNKIIGPDAEECLFPWQVTAQAEQIIWEAYFGKNHDEDFYRDSDDIEKWMPLSAVDETAALTRSGHIYLDVPGGMPNITFDELSREFWSSLGLNKPPANVEELSADLDAGFLVLEELAELSLWERIPNPDSDPARTDLLEELKDIAPDIDAIKEILDTHAVIINENLNSVESKIWLEVGYDEPPTAHRISWFRGRLRENLDEPPQVSQILLNTVAATAAVTRTEENLGNSQGRPGESVRISRTPILTDPKTEMPTLQLDIQNEQRESETWTAVSDFFGAKPDTAVYTVDNESGEVRFGDGVHGRIPVAGSTIIARNYRYGGGLVGNAGPGTITALRSALSHVDSVTNIRAAAGGADAEPLSEVILRAPHDLRTRDRAVTADDFADLAKETPGVRIQRAFALPLTTLDRTTQPPTLQSGKDGAVTVVILPENKEATPQPTEDQLRLVCAYLNQRRLITTELYVTGPNYLELGKLSAQITIDSRSDIKAVHDALTQRLLTYFHPLRGGEDGRGWPFGRNMFFGNVYRQMLAVPGVLRVSSFDMGIENAPPDEPCPDIIPVPEGTLVHVPQSALDLKVTYDPNS